MSKKVRILNGYRLVYLPNHLSAMTNKNWLGYVYEHIAVAEEYLGRKLRDEEVVHHLDLNKANNRIENLLVLERSQHMKLHAWLDSGALIQVTNEMNGVKSVKSKARKPTYCVCGNTLQRKEKTYCSITCKTAESRKVIRPDVNQLANDLASMSWVQVGKKYGVSDNAIRKWAKQYGLL
jgi:hypothetical protein